MLRTRPLAGVRLVGPPLPRTADPPRAQSRPTRHRRAVARPPPDIIFGKDRDEAGQPPHLLGCRRDDQKPRKLVGWVEREAKPTVYAWKFDGFRWRSTHPTVPIK